MRFWLFSAIWIYLGALGLLVCVEVLGIIGMGLSDGLISIFNSTSELTKFVLIFILCPFHFWVIALLPSDYYSYLCTYFYSDPRFKTARPWYNPRTDFCHYIHLFCCGCVVGPFCFRRP